MDGRFLVYVDGRYRLSTHGIRRAIQSARIFGMSAEVIDRDTDRTVWSASDPWLYEYA